MAKATHDELGAALLRRTRGADGGRRVIDWGALDTRGLAAAKRAKVGGSWKSRREQEHLAVGAFALLTSELAAVGCPDVVLSLVTRAGSDEVRHAEICRRVAIAHVGDAAVPSSVHGVPNVPAYVGATLAETALLHVVEMCCLSETVTGTFFTEMAQRATHPVAKEIVESLLEDEIDHGRLGWAYLAARAAEGSVGPLSRELPTLIERALGRFIDAAVRSPEPDDPELEAFAYLGNDAAADVLRRALRDVILPGFETLGVDLGAARTLAKERGWLGG